MNVYGVSVRFIFVFAWILLLDRVAGSANYEYKGCVQYSSNNGPHTGLLNDFAQGSFDLAQCAALCSPGYFGMFRSQCACQQGGFQSFSTVPDQNCNYFQGGQSVSTIYVSYYRSYFDQIPQSTNDVLTTVNHEYHVKGCFRVYNLQNGDGEPYHASWYGPIFGQGQTLDNRGPMSIQQCAVTCSGQSQGYFGMFQGSCFCQEQPFDTQTAVAVDSQYCDGDSITANPDFYDQNNVHVIHEYHYIEVYKYTQFTGPYPVLGCYKVSQSQRDSKRNVLFTYYGPFADQNGNMYEVGNLSVSDCASACAPILQGKFGIFQGRCFCQLTTESGVSNGIEACDIGGGVDHAYTFESGGEPYTQNHPFSVTAYGPQFTPATVGPTGPPLSARFVAIGCFDFAVTDYGSSPGSYDEFYPPFFDHQGRNNLVDAVSLTDCGIACAPIFSGLFAMPNGDCFCQVSNDPGTLDTSANCTITGNGYGKNHKYTLTVQVYGPALALSSSSSSTSLLSTTTTSSAAQTSSTSSTSSASQLSTASTASTSSVAASSSSSTAQVASSSTSIASSISSSSSSVAATSSVSSLTAGTATVASGTSTLATATATFATLTSAVSVSSSSSASQAAVSTSSSTKAVTSSTSTAKASTSSSSTAAVSSSSSTIKGTSTASVLSATSSSTVAASSTSSSSVAASSSSSSNKVVTSSSSLSQASASSSSTLSASSTSSASVLSATSSSTTAKVSSSVVAASSSSSSVATSSTSSSNKVVTSSTSAAQASTSSSSTVLTSTSSTVKGTTTSTFSTATAGLTAATATYTSAASTFSTATNNMATATQAGATTSSSAVAQTSSSSTASASSTTS